MALIQNGFHLQGDWDCGPRRQGSQGCGDFVETQSRIFLVSANDRCVFLDGGMDKSSLR
jgi:hypothetical protein